MRSDRLRFARRATDSAKRVPEHTPTDVNLEIADGIRRSIAYYDEHQEDIPRRLAELDREWDVERTLATSSSGLSLFGLAMAAAGFRRWLYLPLAARRSTCSTRSRAGVRRFRCSGAPASARRTRSSASAPR